MPPAVMRELGTLGVGALTGASAHAFAAERGVSARVLSLRPPRHASARRASTKPRRRFYFYTSSSCVPQLASSQRCDGHTRYTACARPIKGSSHSGRRAPVFGRLSCMATCQSVLTRGGRKQTKRGERRGACGVASHGGPYSLSANRALAGHTEARRLGRLPVIISSSERAPTAFSPTAVPMAGVPP